MLVYSQGGRKVVYALDALFRLPRKKFAGNSHRPAIHGNLFFSDQAAVDEIVAEAVFTPKNKSRIVKAS